MSIATGTHSPHEPERRSEPGAAGVAAQLDRLLAHADRWLQAIVAGGDAPGLAGGGTPDATEGEHFQRAVERFAARADAVLAAVDAQLTGVPSGAGAAVADAVRRDLQALGVGFAVLRQPAAQALCARFDAALSAGGAAAAAAPTGPLRAAVAALRSFVARGAREPGADDGELLGVLDHLGDAPSVDVEAGDDAPLVLRPAGAFADDLAEFVRSARAEGQGAVAAAAALAQAPADDAARQVARRRLAALVGQARLFDLGPIAELADAAGRLVDGGATARPEFDAADSGRLADAAAMLVRLVDGLAGGPLPTVGAWRRLMGALRRRGTAIACSGAIAPPAAISVDDARLARLGAAAMALVSARDRLLSAPALRACDDEALLRRLGEIERAVSDAHAAVAALGVAGDARLDGVVVRAGARCFVVAAADVARGVAVDVDAPTAEPPADLPVLSLAEHFGAPADAAATGGAFLIVAAGGSRAAVRVDEVLGRQQLTVQPLGLPVGPHAPRGGAILADGRIGLVLSASALIAAAGGLVGAAAGGAA